MRMQFLKEDTVASLELALLDVCEHSLLTMGIPTHRRPCTNVWLSNSLLGHISAQIIIEDILSLYVAVTMDHIDD